MKPHAYDALCESLYELDQTQRENLLALLNSRLWYYESADTFTLDHLHEMDTQSLRLLVSEVRLETLALAFKKAIGLHKDTIRSLIGLAEAERIFALMKELGPVRLSEADEAENKILDSAHRLAAEGKITLPPVLRASSVCRKEAMPGEDMLFCRQARMLLLINDEELRHYLARAEVSMLADLLGYANDPRVTRKVLFNLPSRRGEQVLEEIAERWMSYSHGDEKLRTLGRNALTNAVDRMGNEMDMGMLSSWWQ